MITRGVSIGVFCQLVFAIPLHIGPKGHGSGRPFFRLQTMSCPQLHVSQTGGSLISFSPKCPLGCVYCIYYPTTCGPKGHSSRGGLSYPVPNYNWVVLGLLLPSPLGCNSHIQPEWIMAATGFLCLYVYLLPIRIRHFSVKSCGVLPSEWETPTPFSPPYPKPLKIKET